MLSGGGDADKGKHAIAAADCDFPRENTLLSLPTVIPLGETR